MSKIIGIDLGTSTSEVAIIENGKATVINNSLGDKVTPSVVGLSQNGDIIVGAPAKDQFLARPKQTVIEVKRLMGTNQTVFMDEQEYTPQEISSHILKYLKQCAHDYLGEEINRAVITVPAYFTNEQRSATVKAGELAGLKVERIINEPTAAALAYGIDHMEDNSHILVYDLGGGTLDVTLLEMFDGILEVKASSGNNHLGGKDFDEKIISLLLDECEEMYGVSLKDSSRPLARIKDAAESCKIALSTQNEYTINLPFLSHKNGEPFGLIKNITKDDFENLIRDSIFSTQEQIDIVLADAHLKASDIDTVLLVGGSTEIPLVRTFLEDSLGQKPGQVIDPNLAVVMGAAIQGGIINNNLSDESDILITDVSPYTLGLEIMDFIGGVPVTDCYDIIINRNTTIPVVKEKIYTTATNHQEQVEIIIYQGDHKKASSNNLIGKFMLSGIPPNHAGMEEIKVKFMYDINGILKVEAIIASTGEQAGISIETSGVRFDNELDLSGWEQAPNARKYKRTIKKAEKLLDEYFESELYDELDELICSLKKALIKEKDDDLNELLDQINDILYEMEV